MDSETKTRLTFETENFRQTWESPYFDNSVEDILDALYGMLVTATWQPSTIISAMKGYAEDHSYLLYEGNENEIDIN